MKVLFIGGTGRISTAVTKLVAKKKIDLTILNRGKHNTKIPEKVKRITGDIHNKDEMKSILKDLTFDVVVDWIAYTEDDVRRDYELFYGKTKQFIFISSASIYQKPVQKLPVVEESPIGNEHWEYSRNKIKCEEYLMSKHSNEFNVTIIRPSHTYDETNIIAEIKSSTHPYTLIKRIIDEKKIIVCDSGWSLWTLTSNKDFANAFVDVLGNKKTYGEAYHITSNKVYTWDRIHEFIAEALKKPYHPVFIPTDVVLKHFPELDGELKGDKIHNFTFNNSKIRQIAPNYTTKVDYGNSVKKAVKRFLKNKDLQTIDEKFDERYDALIDDFERNYKKDETV